MFVILDAAKLQEAIREAKSLNPDHECLYYGESRQALEEVAPFLFSLPKAHPFTSWHLENSWGSSSGVIIYTRVDFNDCYRHLRKFLLVKTEAGKEMYFRFYDPYVLKLFLRQCNSEQLINFFGPIDAFIVDAGKGKGEAIELRQTEGVLVENTMATVTCLHKV